MNLVLHKTETSGPLPTDTFIAYEGNQKIGLAQLRHQEGGNSKLPENMKSHVYYEVEKEYEGKGYGTEVLRLIKDEACKAGMHEITLVAFEDNIGSNKIIQKNGGEYLWDYVDPQGRRMMKYKIAL